MLPVYFEDYLVGTISTGEGGPAFAYEREWQELRGAFSVSLTMPLNQREVKPETFVPWAANLLPEAAQLAAVGRQLGVAPGDVIGLLSEIGRDTAGALSFGEPGSTASDDWRLIENEAALQRIIDELPNKPFLAGDEGVSMSLAGVQSKVAVAVDDRGAIFIPLNGSPSTHILKPDSERLWGSVENEAFCLKLAELCGLSTARFTTGRAGPRKYLLVARYDRQQRDGRWRRLHQEDFCQALGKPPSAKYERNQIGVRGPTLVDMIKLARARTRPGDILSLLDLAIFNILACNTDAHAKNYSILIRGRADASFAPAYDIMCAEPYEGITRNLAQTIAGKNRGEHIKRRHWERFFQEAGLGVRASLGRVSKMANAVIDLAPAAREQVALMPAVEGAMLGRCEESVLRRARAVLDGVNDKTCTAEDDQREVEEAKSVSGR